MALSSKDIHEVEFRAKGRDGYKAEDVDEFLEFIADGVDELNAMIREMRESGGSTSKPASATPPVDVSKYRTRIAELERQLEEAKTAPGWAATPQSAKAAPADPDAVASATSEAIARTLAMAQRTADMEVEEARTEALKIVADARQQAQLMLEEANRVTMTYADETQTQLRSDVTRLEDARKKLQDDIDLLQKFLAAQQESMKRAITDALTGLEAMPVSSAPPVSDVNIPPEPGKGLTLEAVESKVAQRMSNEAPTASPKSAVSPPKSESTPPKPAASPLPAQPATPATSVQPTTPTPPPDAKPINDQLPPPQPKSQPAHEIQPLLGADNDEPKAPKAAGSTQSVGSSPVPSAADVMRRFNTGEVPVVKTQVSTTPQTSMTTLEDDGIEVEPDPTGQMKYLEDLRSVAAADDEVEVELPFPERDPNEDSKRISEFAGKSRFARKKHRF